MLFFLIANILSTLQLLDDETFVEGTFNYTIQQGTTNVELSKSQCPSSDTTLTIPTTVTHDNIIYTVTSIGEEAFKGCKHYTGDLIVPEEITFIGYKAFSECGFTGSLTFNAQCNIDASLFSLSDKWKGSLTIGNKVPSIGDRAFESIFINTQNAKLTIGSSVKSIGSMAFYRCVFSGGDTIVIPSSVQKVGGQFLSQFKGAKNLDFQATIDVLKQIDMLGLESFETLKISHTTTFGMKCLYGYTNFKTITIENAESFMSYAFANTSFNQDLVISDSVTSLGTGCFSYSKWTGSLTIKANVYEIDPSIFSHATFGGSKLIIENVQSIGPRAFEGCFTSKISIEINSIKVFGSMAFYGCNVETITVPATTYLIGRAAFCGAKGDKLNIKTQLKDTNSTWFDGENQIQQLELGSNFEVIGESTFENCKNFPGGLTISGSIKKIEDKAFYKCSGFTGSLTIPETVTYIGTNSFSYCSGFTKDLTINANVESIDQTMFSELSGFEGSLTIGSHIKLIDVRAFEYITCFKQNLVIGSNVETIGFNAFYNTQFKTSLTIPEKVSKIGSQAFMKSSFTSLHILSTNINLSKNCFVQMGSLSSITYCGYNEISFDGPVFDDSINSINVVSYYSFTTVCEKPVNYVKCSNCNVVFPGHECTDISRTQTPTLEQTPSQSQSPSQSLAQTPSQSPAQTPSESPIQTPIQSPAQTPSESPIQTAAQTPAQTPSESPIQTAVQTPVQSPAQTPSESPIQTAVQTPAHTPEQTPSGSPIQTPAKTPAHTPEQTPVETPTKVPPQSPSHSPTEIPLQTPTKSPTYSPTEIPAQTPSQSPTRSPTNIPDQTASQSPTKLPTKSLTPTPPLTPSMTPTPAQGSIIIIPPDNTITITEPKVQQINVVGDATIDIETSTSLTLQPDEDNNNKKSVLTFNNIQSSELKIKSFNDISVILNSNSPIVFEDSSSITVDASKSLTINEVKSHSKSNNVNFKASGSEVTIQKVSIDGQSKSISFEGNSKVKDVDISSNSKGTLNKAVVSGTTSINTGSDLEISQCEFKPSVFNLQYRDFQSKTRLRIRNSRNLALAATFEPGNVNIKFDDVDSTGEVNVIEGIDDGKCKSMLNNVHLPSQRFSSVCQNGNLVVKAQNEENPDNSSKESKTNTTLYIVIGIIAAVLVIVIVVIVVIIIKKKNDPTKYNAMDKSESENPTSSLQSPLLF